MRIAAIHFLFLCFGVISAQHYQFSQFYAAQTYLNPAFTGANSCAKLALNYRSQWSKVPGGYTTYQVSYDKPLKQINSGLGCIFFTDKAGPGSLKTISFNLLYAYELRLSKTVAVRAGISPGFTQRSIDYSALTFGDQIARGGAANSVEDLSTSKTVYFDLNMGYLVYSSNAWGGLAINHLTRPNQSLQGGNSPLPMEFKFHGGYKFLLKEDASNSKEQHSITAAINYKKELKFNQLDIGGFYTKGFFVVGLWYRGIPLYKPFKWYSSNDAVTILVGLSTDKLNIGYSFDYTVSKLNISNTNGTHEISLSYPFCGKKKGKRKQILISCPKF
jgi:type IX secretion system PorP/SprF family membrane protein